jgi:hypothetical protein
VFLALECKDWAHGCQQTPDTRYRRAPGEAIHPSLHLIDLAGRLKYLFLFSRL